MVQIHDRFDDGEPESCTAGNSAFPGRIGAVEPFEDPFYMRRSNPWAAIGQQNHYRARLLPTFNVDRRIAWRVRDRISEQVADRALI